MVKTAIVGYGYWGPNLLRNFFETEGCEVLYVCDKDVTKLKEVRRRYPSIILTPNFEDVLGDEEVSAVVIATPTKFHYRLGKAAMEAGKDVLLEKPMTLNSEEGRSLVDVAKKTKRLIMVDHTFLFTEAVRKLKKIIDSGEIGEIVYIDSVRVSLGLFQEDSNVFFDLAAHDISILKYLLGKDPVSVISTAFRKYSKQEEVGYIHLNYPRGVTCNIHVSWLSPLKARRMMIVGTKKMVIYDDIEQSEKIKTYDKGVKMEEQLRIGYRSGDVWSPNLEIKEALKTMASEFVASIAKRKTPVSDGEFGLSVVKILEGATISARTGRRFNFKNANSKRR